MGITPLQHDNFLINFYTTRQFLVQNMANRYTTARQIYLFSQANFGAFAGVVFLSKRKHSFVHIWLWRSFARFITLRKRQMCIGVLFQWRNDCFLRIPPMVLQRALFVGACVHILFYLFTFGFGTIFNDFIINMNTVPINYKIINKFQMLKNYKRFMSQKYL